MRRAGAAPDDLYGSLRDEVTRWQVVHLGTLVFIASWALRTTCFKDLPARKLTRGIGRSHAGTDAGVRG